MVLLPQTPITTGPAAGRSLFAQPRANQVINGCEIYFPCTSDCQLCGPIEIISYYAILRHKKGKLWVHVR